MSAEVPKLIRELYSIVAKLERLYPGRKFTLDGHLVGSIGEVIAADRYGLELLPASTETHDAKMSDGRLVQIKATQSKSIGLRSKPNYLIVLQLQANGKATEIYSGPGAVVWAACGPLQKNGQKHIGIAKLQNLAGKTKGGYSSHSPRTPMKSRSKSL